MNEAGVIITQFIVLMQQQGVWPCHLIPGEEPQPMAVEALASMKNEYLEIHHE